MSLPRAFKKRKKPKEYKLRSFVAILFLAAVFLVGFAHIFYHQQVLQRLYFDNFRFNKEDRVVRLYNSEGETVVGYVGRWLPSGERVYDCLESDQRPGMYCWEWMHRARLYLSQQGAGKDFTCFTFTWVSLHQDTVLTDCFENGDKYGHWYGGGRTLGMAWPVELGKVEMSPFVTGYIGQHRWGGVLKRYFINSKGVALYIDQQTPLYVSINAGPEARLCLQARHDDFAYVTHEGLPRLNYSLCSSGNIRQLHAHLSEKSLWDGLKETDLHTIHYLLSEPVWQLDPPAGHLLTEAAVVNYTDDVIALGFLGQGHVLLNEHWQENEGDLTFDEKRFPTIDKTIEIIQRRGFRISLTIQPFIGTESINFPLTAQAGLLVKERAGKQQKRQGVPALTKYKGLHTAAMLDITNNQTVSWLHQKLSDLSHKYQIDSFYLDLGTAYDMPHYYELSENLTNPDHYKTVFTRQVIIPMILTYGIVGYPFLLPGPVGGDYCLADPSQAHTFKGLADKPIGGRNSSFDALSVEDLRLSCDLPNKELYLRWLQLSTFLPVIRYSHLPSDYKDDSLLDQAKLLTALREKTVTPLLKKYTEEALDRGAPLIRPLWMLDPADSTCHTVKDEFSVGEDLIVAPILESGVTEREVYLPAGVWKDGIDSSLRKGSRWLHSYRVPLDRIAYFIKMPDNTRF